MTHLRRAHRSRDGQRRISLETADGWDDFLTGLEHRLQGLGAAGLSLGVVNDTQVHTFNRGFSESTSTRFSVLPVDTELPGPAALRTLAPQFLDSSKMALARYPKAADVLEGTDFSAAACLPLVKQGDNEALGYLAVHYEGARHFDRGDRATLWRTATETTAAIHRLQNDVRRQGAQTRSAASVEALHAELTGLRQAMVNRAEIEQAKGMLMERFALDSERAWELMRGMSNHANRKLSAVARDIVEGVEGPGSRSQ